MANEHVNRVVYDGRTLVDLTSDTVDAAHLAVGYTAHGASGAPVTGTLAFSTIHTSSSAPTSSQGSNGDVWLVVS